MKDRVLKFRQEHNLTAHDVLRTIGLPIDSTNLKFASGHYKITRGERGKKFSKDFAAFLTDFDASKIQRSNLTSEIVLSYQWDNSAELEKNGIGIILFKEDPQTLSVFTYGWVELNEKILEPLLAQIGHPPVVRDGVLLR